MTFRQILRFNYKIFGICILLSFKVTAQETQMNGNPGAGLGSGTTAAINSLSPANEVCVDESDFSCLYRYSLTRSDGMTSATDQVQMGIIEESTGWIKSQCIVPAEQFPNVNWSHLGIGYIFISETVCGDKKSIRSIPVDDTPEIDPFAIPKVEKKMNVTPYYFRNQIQFIVDNTGSFDSLSCRMIQPVKGKLKSMHLTKGLNHLSFSPKEFGIKNKMDMVIIEVKIANGDTYLINYQRK